jgi:hypothetical protein
MDGNQKPRTEGGQNPVGGGGGHMGGAPGVGVLMSTMAWVSGYCEKPVTQKRLSHACLIIEILA